MVIFHRSPLANLRTVLQIRVIAPSGLRELVIGVLDSEPGVAHVVVHRDAALDPPGDEITADIAREAANDVVDAQGAWCASARRYHDGGPRHGVVHRRLPGRGRSRG